jgi:hypothetical protein
MLLAFLAAEVNSDHCREHALNGLRHALQYRGYPDASLFDGFPADVTWSRVSLTRPEICTLLYGKGGGMEGWMRASRGTRLVAEVASNPGSLDPATEAIIDAIVERVRSDGHVSELIVATTAPGAPLVLVEGYKRATAYCRTLPDDAEVPALLGTSVRMGEWTRY